jgi:hypothetical protein
MTLGIVDGHLFVVVQARGSLRRIAMCQYPAYIRQHEPRIRNSGGAGRLPPRRSLAWGYHTNQGANIMAMLPEAVARCISFLMGEVHGLVTFSQALALAYSHPDALLACLGIFEQSGLANLESQPVPDSAVEGYQFVLGGIRKAVEAAAGRLQTPSADQE